MLKVMILTADQARLAGLIKALDDRDGLETVLAATTAEAVELIGRDRVDLVIVDETVDGRPGQEAVPSLLMKNALVNIALVSDLEEEEFHEVTEGLGLLDRLPRQAGAAEAGALLKKLEAILG